MEEIIREITFFKKGGGKCRGTENVRMRERGSREILAVRRKF